ncbi:YARHG domain-containing protein [Roseixanthobacter liquoris]|uniref:YARHG domain-containing protein n=1 Tax=Roseixanthobacter liquoris TaxID=3119921 RepID=UPI00372BE443
MNPPAILRRLLLGIGAATFAVPLLPAPAGAQTYADLSCRALWYSRNAIYADRGYCFRTPDARAVFGNACFPPYGQLSASEQREVEIIRSWEARRGCPR